MSEKYIIPLEQLKDLTIELNNSNGWPIFPSLSVRNPAQGHTVSFTTTAKLVWALFLHLPNREKQLWKVYTKGDKKTGRRARDLARRKSGKTGHKYTAEKILFEEQKDEKIKAQGPYGGHNNSSITGPQENAEVKISFGKQLVRRDWTEDLKALEALGPSGAGEAIAQAEENIRRAIERGLLCGITVNNDDDDGKGPSNNGPTQAEPSSIDEMLAGIYAAAVSDVESE